MAHLGAESLRLTRKFNCDVDRVGGPVLNQEKQ